MEKEFMRLYESMNKAADLATTSVNSKVEEDRCLDALKLLKKFPVTYEILVSAQIGKHLRGLTKHPEKKIQAFAMDLVEIWKAIVIKGVIKNKKGKVYQKPSNKTVSAENVKVENVQKTHVRRLKVTKGVVDIAKDEKKQVFVETLKKPSSSPVAPPKQKTLVKSNDATRDKIREILQEAFSKVSGEADETKMDQVKACDPMRLSVAVESVLFQRWGYFNGVQKMKYRSLIFNLKDPKNPDFRRRVVLGEFTPEQLMKMKTEDMASDERKKENEMIKMKGLVKCEHKQKQKATTDQFVCEKYGKRECTFYQMQTRSADEPMTTYVTCVLCNHHMKFY